LQQGQVKRFRGAAQTFGIQRLRSLAQRRDLPGRLHYDMPPPFRYAAARSDASGRTWFGKRIRTASARPDDAAAIGKRSSATEACYKAGVGALIPPLGATLDRKASQPVKAEAVVKFLLLAEPNPSRREALVQIQGITLVLAA
jgi:hypothetical protein